MKRLLLPGLLLCSVLCCAQQPLFDSMAAWPVKENVRMFQVKDITGDGVADLTTMYPAVQERFGILTGKGNGSFGQERLYAKPLNYFRNDIADLNKDGFPELMISSYWDNGFRIYYGNAAGRFDSSVYMPTDVHGREIRCADIDKDGYIDLVASCDNSTIYTVFNNKGKGSVPTTELLVYPNPAHSTICLKGLPAGRHIITLYSANGIMLHSTVTSDKWWNLPVEHLPAGMYFLNVAGKGINATRGFRKL